LFAVIKERFTHKKTEEENFCLATEAVAKQPGLPESL
jgi:hypothetical protein